VASVEAAEPIREDADTPPAPVVYQGGPVEFDRVVPASGNLAVRGKQFWLGPARAGVTVTFWADHDVIHLSIAGARVKTVRSHLSTTDLAAWLPPGAARPARRRCPQPNPAPSWKSIAPSLKEAWSPSVSTGCSPRKSSAAAE
jgi:hypothetical protein